MNQHSNIKSAIAYDDLREWLALAERLGEVREVSGRELAGGYRARCRGDLARRKRAVRRVRRYSRLPEGLSRPAQHVRRQAPQHDAGFPDHLTKWELSDAYREAYLEDQKIIPHQIVDDGPVLENVLTGDDIDVTKFPAPIWHEKDGGRYIGTGTYSITRDPEENWLNAGAYRAQVHDRKSVGIRDRRRDITATSTARNISSAASRCRSRWCWAAIRWLLLRRPRSALRHLRDRHRRRPARPADEDGARQGHRTAVPRQCRDRARRFCHAGQDARSKGRSANGPATMPAAQSPIRCSTSRRSITATIRSWSACRRWAAGPDEMARYRAVLRSATIKQNMTNAGVPGVAAGVVPRDRRRARCSTRCRSHSAIPAMPCRRARSPRNAAPRPMRRNTSWSSTTMSTSPISIICCGRCSRAPIRRNRSSSSTARGIRRPIRRCRRTRRAVGDMTHSVAMINACKPCHWRDKFPPTNTPSPEVARKAREKFGWLLDGKK